MTSADRDHLERRVLVLTATSKDASLTAEILDRAGVASAVCASLEQVCAELAAGASAVLVVEEAVTADGGSCLDDWLSRQPPWSDLPLLVLARPGADSSAVAAAMDSLGNVTVLERPLRVAALVSAVRTALRARQRQYQARQHLIDRELAAEDLRHSEEQLLVAVAAAKLGQWTIDFRTWEMTCSDACKANFGRKRGDRLTYFDLWEAVHPDDRPRVQAEVERAIATASDYDTEYQAVWPDGSLHWVMARGRASYDLEGKPFMMTGVTLDITERKRAEEQIRRGSDLLHFLIDRSPFGFYIVDADFRISHVNADSQARAFRNVRPAIGRGLDEAMRILWPEPLASEIIAIFRHTLETGEPYRSPGLVSPRQDLGAVETYEWQLERILLPEGRYGVVCYYYDTTRLREAEQALRDADRRKDEFLATLAHELRNPLAPIRNSLHILRLTTQQDPAAEQVSEVLERQVNHMVRLVDDLLEVSRITRGKIELRQEPVELAAIIRNAVETSRPLIDSAGHQLAIALPSEPVTLQGDSVRLTQVVANLLNNAAKYTDAGGQIWLAARREGSEVAISVRDTGTGISPEMLPRVFELFTQVDRNASRSQGGLGIGLTLVKSLVELHGGSVEARSEGPGRGSEFVVRLPLSPVQAPAAPPAKPVRGGDVLSARRVLVVDDNRDSAESLGMILRLLGAEVRVVCSGPEAFEVLADYQPSAVLLDIGMPGMDGYEVARRIRQDPALREVTLIALTGWAQEDDRRRSHDAGFDHHLTKPAELAALQTLLLSLNDGPRGR